MYSVSFIIMKQFLDRLGCKMKSTCFQRSSSVQSQLDIRTANFLQTFIASENSLCYFFSLTARRELDKVFAQFDNVTTARYSFMMLYLTASFAHHTLSSEAYVNII